MLIARQHSILVVLAAAGGLAACGRATNTSQSDDFSNDLKLASATTMDLATPRVDPSLLNSSLENQPQGAPHVAAVVKRAPGPRVVQSKTRTHRAASTTDVAAASQTTDQTTTVESAPAPDVSEPVAVAPRPTPGAQTGTGSAPGDYGTSGNGGGIFGPGGGLGGVVIFGGGADGDHCEPRGGRRGGGGMGGMGGIGGMGGPIIIPSSPMPRTGGIGYPRRGGGIGGVGGVSRVGGGGGVSRSPGSSGIGRPGAIGVRGRRG